jgi:hypothetical protein
VTDTGDYALGIAGLIAIVVSLGLAARTARRGLLPGWTGAPALLAEGVLGIGMLVLLSELLGVFGVLDGALLVAACVIVGLSSFQVEATLGPDEGKGMRAGKKVYPLEIGLAVAIALLVAAQWAGPTLLALHRGIYGGDSLWYHLPFAAHMAQTGSVTSLLFTDPLYLNWFYPQVSELAHADGLLLLGNDFLSPLLNLAWLALALLAAWCIGRPYASGPASVAATAALMSADLMFSRQPGNANNDIVAIALLLASVAILVNSTAWRTPDGGPAGIPKKSSVPDGPPAGVLVVAGLAAGLALGTKLTVVPPILALTVGVIVISGAGTRLRAAATWIGALLAGGGFWYLRDAVVAHTPFPFVDIGPLTKPEDLEGRDPFSIAHYATDSSVWGKYFTPGLEERLGDLWPLFLAAAVAGVVVWLWRGTRLERMLAAVAAFSALAYLLTPLGASGPEGMPVGFRLNIRYLAPGLSLALVLAAITPSLFRWPLPWRYASFGLFAALALASSDILGGIDTDRIPGTVVIAFALVALPAGLVLLSRRGAPKIAVIAVAATCVVGLAIAGRIAQDDYLDLRYSDSAADYPTDEQPATELGQGLGAAYQWARDTHDVQIGLVGTTGALFQYGLWGPDSSNEVTYVGDRGDRGAFRDIAACPEFIAAVNDGRYDFVVTTPPYDQDDPESAGIPVQRAWMDATGARRVAGEGLVDVWQLAGPLDPAACANAPESEASAGPGTDL